MKPNQTDTDSLLNEPITCPFTVIVDTREQSPFHFQNFKSDAKQNCRPLYIPTEVKTLKTGDYSVSGFESEICVERKSLSDLFGTLGNGRCRFIKQLNRMAEMRFSAVVIEANQDYAIANPPRHSGFSPKMVFRSINAWEQEFPTIHWHWMSNKSIAEHKTFRILERFWNQTQKKIANSE